MSKQKVICSLELEYLLDDYATRYEDVQYSMLQDTDVALVRP